MTESTLDEKMKSYYGPENVKDHGAKGDEFTDDTAAFQSAADAATRKPVGDGITDDTEAIQALQDKPQRRRKPKACKHEDPIRKLGRPYCTDCGEFV